MKNASPFLASGSDSKILGTNARKSLSRFERVSRTMTAMSNSERCCWNDRFESTVRKISNSFSASASSFPFFNEAQPICGTVLTKCPARRPQSFRGIHSSKRIFTLRGRSQYQVLGFLKKRDGHFTRNSWKVIKKFVQRVATFDVINQRFGWNSRSGEAGRAAHDFRIGNDNLLFHTSTIHEP